MTRIIRLKTENIMRLKAVEIKPEGNVVTIGGKNRQGKTSVLRSIAMGLGGKKYQPGKPVRDGEEEGRIEIETEDYTIRYVVKPDGKASYHIESHDGARYGSPRAWLEKKIAFDPLAFMSLSARDQSDQIRAMLGIDTTEIDAKRKAAYDDRTDIGREGKRLKGQVESMPHHDDAPGEKVSIKDLVNELGDIEHSNGVIREFESKLYDAEWMVVEADKNVERLEAELGVAKVARDKALAGLSDLTKREGGRRLIDTDDIQNRISDAEGLNSKVRDNQSCAAATAELDATKKNWDVKTAELEALDAEKAALLAGIEFPIDGMAIDDDGLTYHGVPLDQASSADCIEVSVAIGCARNPELGVMLVYEGSLLDTDSTQLLTDLAEKNDLQVWVECVGDGDGFQFVIEDGNLRE